MATETDTRPSFFNQSWYCQDLPSDNQTHEDGSTILDHGSFSFGRYAGELAWEKRSVFTHNRCQEELEKFKAPGLVSQKKAYFEEYYRKIRAAKELQAQEQETSKLVPSQEIQGSSLTTDNATDAAVMSERDEHNTFSGTEILGYTKTDDMNSFEVGISNDTEQALKEVSRDCSESKDANLTDGACVSLTVDGLENSPKRASHSRILSTGKRSETVHQNGPVSRRVWGDVDKIRKSEPFIKVLKDKDTVTSAKKKMKLRNRPMKNVRMFGNPIPSPQVVKSSKVENILPARKGSTQTVAHNINRKTSEARSSVVSLHSSSANSKMVSSASNVRDNKGKTASDFHGSGNNLKTKLLVPSRYAKGTSKEVTVTSSLKSMTLNVRLTVTRPKDLPDRGKTNRSISVEGNNRHNKEVNGKQGKENVGARIKRGPMMVTRSQKDSVPKLDQKEKILTRQSADPMLAQRQQRERKPIWR